MRILFEDFFDFLGDDVLKHDNRRSKLYSKTSFKALNVTFGTALDARLLYLIVLSAPAAGKLPLQNEKVSVRLST